MVRKPKHEGELVDGVPLLLQRVRARGRFQTVFDGLSMTRQSEKDKCDVNLILKQFRVTGVLPNRGAPGRYEDLPSSMDYQEAMNVTLAAQAAFADLPSKIRERFGNDPESLLRFLGDPENRDEAIKLGLLDRPPPVDEPPAGGGGGPKEPPVSPEAKSQAKS